MSSIIRLARPTHRSTIRRPGSTSSRFTPAAPATRGDTARLVESRTPSGRLMRLVAQVDKDANGMATDYAVRLAPYQIARIRLEPLTPSHYWIDWVYVPEAYRGQGLARQLMLHVIKDADRAGVRLSLEPRACGGVDQEALQAWYRSFGFVDTGRRGYFGPIYARPARAGKSVA